jgi:hypothetical protein
MGTSFVNTDATVTGTAGLSLDLGSSAEGPAEQAPRKIKPAKKNLATRRGLADSRINALMFNGYDSPVNGWKDSNSTLKL